MTEKRVRLDDEALEDLLAAYSLGALAPEEHAALEARLDEPGVRERLAGYAPVIEALALAAPQHTPPAALGERLAARLDAETAPTPRPAGKVIRSSVWQRFTPWLAAAAMFIVSVGLGVRVWQQQTQLTELQTVLTAPRVVGMEAGEVAPQAQGRFYLAPSSHQGVLIVADLPPLPDDKAYQLWLVDKNGQRDNGGTFRVDKQGYGTHLVQAPRPMSDYVRIGVTTEPRGGSPGPTSGRVVGASLENAQRYDY